MNTNQRKSQTVGTSPESATPSIITIEEKLEDIRRRLLDLTRRNRLLNHRTKGRATLRIVDEIPAEVFRQLVVNEGTLQFLAREEAPQGAVAFVETEASREQENGGDTEPAIRAFTLPPIDGTTHDARHTDRNLQTALTGEVLQSRLLHLARQAESAREEQGCNVLYITLGIIEWREKPGDPPSRAPLLFIPVNLQRRTAKHRHNVQRFEDESLINPCLIELCRRQFKFELPLVDIDEMLDLNQYFAQISATISDIPGWSFLPEIHLGLFSFAKLLMYRDMDPANWPTRHRLSIHPIIQRLAGFPTPLSDDQSSMPLAEQLDNTPVLDNYHVVDADSSQQVAIQAVKDGLNTVIEGPPGTGKSQTITNIIAESLAAGKSVLFVAEKAAALSVVKRRLESVGLGDAVLELHSNKTSKRLVLDDIQRTLAAYDETLAVDRLEPDVLEQSRRQLSAYAHELHLPISALHLSVYQAINRLLPLMTAPEAAIVIEQPLTWDAARLHAAHECISAFDRYRSRVGVIALHPWRQLTLRQTGTLTRQRMQRTLSNLVSALRQLEEAISLTADMLQVAVPTVGSTVQSLVERSNMLLALPNLAPGSIADERWEIRAEEVQIWIAAGSARQQRKAIWSEWFTPEAEKHPWGEIIQRRNTHTQSLAHRLLPGGVEDKLMQILSSEWKADAQQIESFLIPDKTLSFQEQLDQLVILSQSAELRTQTLSGVRLFADLFRTHWQNIDGDWDDLQKILQTALNARHIVATGIVGQRAAEEALENGRRQSFLRQTNTLIEAFAQTEQAFTEWYAAAETNEQVWLTQSWQRVDLGTLITRHESLQEAFGQLDDWTLYQESRARLLEDLPDFLTWAERTQIDATVALVHCFDRQFYQLWLDDALRNHPILAAFEGEECEAVMQRFNASDKRWIENNRRRVAASVRSRIPDLGRETHRQSKLGIIKAEFRKKRRIMPLRQLFAQTGEVLQALKPCFMMSPISIAQFLAPGAITFDVVIFDEASQVEPADAYGAISRGRQLILVGDEKQLPPTHFFNKIESDTPLGDDEDLTVTDLESVLSLGIVRLQHQCSLRWHYRSRHSSLIEFSNQQFYDGKLRVFPGPYASTSEYGLRHHFVAEGVYMRGAGQYNPPEARAVAMAAVEHAIATPHLTLGVGAFSVAQQRAIEDEIELLRRTSTDSRVEAFFAARTSEPFFVKNLETIQGDERDVILLSVGYGPDQQGKITMNFGPLNRNGGWRRLNVLVTRARQRCVLFSSIRSDQINLSVTRARGVAALKAYLYLAEHGYSPELANHADDRVAELATHVSTILRMHGWQVHERVGTVNSFVDMAVVDPDQPERYLVGIETDGESFATASTARDRARLRPQVLSDLGWRLQRVWTLDWYRRPHFAIQHVLSQLEAARNYNAHPPLQAEEAEQPTEQLPYDHPVSDMPKASGNAHQEVKTLPNYSVSSLRTEPSTFSIEHISAAALGTIIERIVFDESPIHEDEIQRVLAVHFSTRASKRIQQICSALLPVLAADGKIRRQGMFLWAPHMIDAPVRYRGNTCPVTRPELIPPEELQAAVRQVLNEQFGLQRDALIVSTSRLLGFRRCGTALELAIGKAVNHLLTMEEAYIDQHQFIMLRSYV